MRIRNGPEVFFEARHVDGRDEQRKAAGARPLLEKMNELAKKGLTVVLGADDAGVRDD